MQSLESLFGESPFVQMALHVRKTHECVSLVRPIADAIIAGDLPTLRLLQDRISQAEFEADRIKDGLQQQLPRRVFLPVHRDDLLSFVRQLNRMGDDAQDFAVVATFRPLQVPPLVQPVFLELVDRVVQASEALLRLAEELAEVQKESFVGSEAEDILHRLARMGNMEWEVNKLSRKCARAYYTAPDLDAVTLILLDKLCKALTGIAGHAENVSKSLRLLIVRS